MSIINDALKKIQIRYIQKDLSQKITDKKGRPWIAIAMFFLGFLGCLTALALLNTSKKPIYLINPLIKILNQEYSAKTPIAPQPLAPSPQTPSKSKNPSPDKNTLKLHGILTMNGKQIALINNEILREGDSIDDKRILRITEDRVELSDNDEIIILKAK